jgi:hypothetical protein
MAMCNAYKVQHDKRQTQYLVSFKEIASWRFPITEIGAMGAMEYHLSLWPDIHHFHNQI